MIMGSEEDPEDGGAVAASIFIAVAVYAVRENNEITQDPSSLFLCASVSKNNLKIIWGRKWDTKNFC